MKIQAVLVADVRIRNIGTGRRMILALRDKSVLRVRPSPEVLRLRLNLQRRYRATFSLRTQPSGLLLEPLHLTRLEQIITPIQNDSGTSWSVTGLVASHPQTVVIWGGRGSWPSQISYKTVPELLTVLTAGESVRLEGVLKDRCLLATGSEVLPSLRLPLRERRKNRWSQEFLQPQLKDVDTDH